MSGVKESEEYLKSIFEHEEYGERVYQCDFKKYADLRVCEAIEELADKDVKEFIENNKCSPLLYEKDDKVLSYDECKHALSISEAKHRKEMEGMFTVGDAINVLYGAFDTYNSTTCDVAGYDICNHVVDIFQQQLSELKKEGKR